MLLPLLLTHFAVYGHHFHEDGAHLDVISEAVVAQKAKMNNRYTLRLRVESRTPSARPPLESAWGMNLNIWRDGDKFRVDQFDAQYTPKRPQYIAGSRHVTCENCEKPGYSIVTTVLAGSPPTLHVVSFHPLDSRSFDYDCTHFDWRYLGLCNASKCLYTQLHIATSFSEFFRQPGISARAASRGNVPCLVSKLSSVARDQVVWLSTHDGYHPIYFEDIFQADGEPEIHSTEVSWQRTAGGHFYPKSVNNKTTIRFGSSKYTTEEVITVLHADFDSPIEPSTFTLSGLGLNENQAIGYPGLKTEEMPLWRQGKVDGSYTVRDHMRNTSPNSGSGSLDGMSHVDNIAPYPSSSTAALVIGIVAGVLSLTAAITAVVIRLRRARV